MTDYPTEPAVTGNCPSCASPLVQVGPFLICPKHGQLYTSIPQDNLRIFLSYGHDPNEELVRLIKADLESRGHEVWYDKSEIKVGDDWRRAITDGITRSHRFLSFLSKHSIRDPGVCLDEIAIAIGVKGGNIQTVLVEGETDVKPPPSISHIQWLDMHDWQEKRTSGESVWERWYGDKLSEIVRVIESDESRRFAGEIESLNELLTPISPDTRIASLLRTAFVGRQWMFDALETWRTAPTRTSRIFWIIGDPGVGKSAFAAHLSHFGRDKVVAAQFVEYDKPDHRDAGRIIRSLAFQLATRFPDYRRLLLTSPELADLANKDPADLFDSLLAGPLHNAIGGGRERYLVVIDALDEATLAGRNTLVDILANNADRLPEWLGFVVTSRPEAAVKTPLQGLKPFILDTRTEDNRADIREYVTHRLHNLLETRADADEIVVRMLDKSEGVFLYVEKVCEDLLSGHLMLDEVETFPRGLAGVLWSNFSRHFPDMRDYQDRIRPTLRAIVAAREPLPVDTLRRTFDWDEESFRDILRSLGSLFQETTSRDARVIKPYHKSLADWLIDEKQSARYFVSLTEGHRLLADACWREYRGGVEGMSDYAVRHVRAHLTRIGYAAEREEIEADGSYIDRLRSMSPEQRSLSVYISSTFRDMHLERDHLVRYVFPMLREHCQENDIIFSSTDLAEIDLRWGVPTDDGSDPLRTVLTAIDDCRPYFIGLVGEQYGWIPPDLPAGTVDRYPWLRDCLGMSTFEIEARYGLRSEKPLESRPCFYLRDPDASAERHHSRHLDQPGVNPELALRMARFKNFLRDASSEEGIVLREGFRTPEELGRWVLQDLMTQFDALEKLEAWSSDTRRHHGYARQHVRSYVPRPDIDGLIDETVGRSAPLIILGGPGSGKSSLLANWALRRQEMHPLEVILTHFAGRVPDSVDIEAMLRRLMNELKKACYISELVPETLETMLRSLPTFLQQAVQGDRVVFVIDGVEMLEGEQGLVAQVLRILSGSGAPVLAATADPRLSDELSGAGWLAFHLPDLNPAERSEVISTYLATYARQLTEVQLQRICSAPSSGNPQYLLTLLEELRVSADHFTIDAWIDRYSSTPSLHALYDLVLDRMERENGGQSLANVLLPMLDDRGGISRDEVLRVMAGSPSFVYQLRSIAVETDGTFRIHDPVWRDAIRNRYSPEM